MKVLIVIAKAFGSDDRKYSRRGGSSLDVAPVTSLLCRDECGVCHTEANQGSYSEHQVIIPGYGRWED